MIDARFPNTDEARQDLVMNALSIFSYLIDLSTPPELRDLAKLHTLQLFAQHWDLEVILLPTPPGAPEELTLDAAARLLEVVPSTIYGWCEEGLLPSRKHGKHRLVRRADLLALRLMPKRQRPGKQYAEETP